MKKTIVLSLVTGLALGATAFAQGGDGHRGKGFGHFFDRLDQNGDGKITQAELQADVQARFAEFDTNKDGKISADEVKQHADAKIEQHREHRDERLKEADKNGDGKWTKDELSRMPERMFAKLDTNNDGVLTRDELEAGRAKFDEHREGFLEHVFEKADTNKDGFIDSTEALKLAQTRFDKVDANHDGIVDRDEWKAGHPHRGMFRHAWHKSDKPAASTSAPSGHT